MKLPNRILNFLFFCFVVGCSASFLFSEQAVGKLEYFEGIVDVFRDGEMLDWRLVDMGLIINEYDLMETADDGYAEVRITSPSAGGIMVKVQPETSFYFDINRGNGGTKTKVQMLAGSLAMKVDKLTSKDSVVIHTESAVMGVRGTDFEVTTAPDGSLLVTCIEGRVACRAEDGSELLVEPGSVVENLSNGVFRSVDVPVNRLEAYKSAWEQERLEIFRDGALTFIKAYYLQFNRQYPDFIEAYKALIPFKPDLKEIAKDPSRIANGTIIKFKSYLGPVVTRMLTIYRLFEPAFYRLIELEGFHDQGYGRGDLKRRYSTTDFFNELKRGQRTISYQLAQVRYMFKLYGRLDQGVFGEDPLSADFLSGDDPFNSLEDDMDESDMESDLMDDFGDIPGIGGRF